MDDRLDRPLPAQAEAAGDESTAQVRTMMMRRSGMLMVAAAALAPVRGVPAPGSPHTSNATDVDGQWARLPGYAATVATGISFYTAEQGMVIGGSNGIGPQVSTTFDGGATFHSAHFETEDPLFMFVDGEMLRGSSVVSGFMAWAWQSQDQAREFHAADAPLPINPGPKYVDSVLYNGAPTFVITGDTGFFNGVSISRDSGRTFEAGINIFDDRSTEGSMWARSFAADPTGERWFVSGGAWSSGPASDDDDSDDAYIHFSEQLHLRRDALNASGPLLEFRKAPAVPRYTAGMARSDDGGRTWRLVYESENQFYFSGMACFDRVRLIPIACCLLCNHALTS